MREPGDVPQAVIVAATDPANPYGATLKWSFDSLALAQDGPSGPAHTPQGKTEVAGRGPIRTVGALVVLVDGYPVAYLRRGERELLLHPPDSEPQRSAYTKAAARALMNLAKSREEGTARDVDRRDQRRRCELAHCSAPLRGPRGFNATAMGLQARVPPTRPGVVPEVEFLPADA
jgi:ATP-dependent Lhr-like helicase